MIKMPGLKSTMPLYKILTTCEPWHRIDLIEAHDGALIMKCYDCTFTHVLLESEESIARKRLDHQPHP